MRRYSLKFNGGDTGMFASDSGDYIHIADLRPLLRKAVYVIEQLSEQQAMPDDFYQDTLDELNKAIK